MKSKNRNRIISVKNLSALLVLVLVASLNSCSNQYVKHINANTKTKFGFEITAPTKAVFFVTNQKIPISGNASKHREIANSLNNKYGPATDNFFIASTNAKDVKFNLADKTYYIDVEQLPRRTAMILFDGKHKPVIKFNPKKYGKCIIKIK